MRRQLPSKGLRFVRNLTYITVILVDLRLMREKSIYHMRKSLYIILSEVTCLESNSLWFGANRKGFIIYRLGK